MWLARKNSRGMPQYHQEMNVIGWKEFKVDAAEWSRQSSLGDLATVI